MSDTQLGIETLFAEPWAPWVFLLVGLAVAGFWWWTSRRASWGNGERLAIGLAILVVVSTAGWILHR